MKGRIFEIRKLLLTLVFFTASPSSLFAFPIAPGMPLLMDPAFQACMDQALIANNWSSTEQVTELICPDQDIEFLGGIEQLTELTRLDLNGNNIRDTFPLGFLNSLNQLNLNNNKLDNLNTLTQKHNLQQLSLNGNTSLQKTEIQIIIGNNPGLTHLELAGIKLNEPVGAWLPPANAAGEYNCRVLDVSETSEFFDLMWFSQYPDLKNLKASGVNLHNLGPIYQLQQLESLDLSHNKLLDLQGSENLNHLKLLNLSGNAQLDPEQVKLLIHRNPSLYSISVADIPMGYDLSWLPPMGFQGEFDLQHLDVSRTGLKHGLFSVERFPNLKVIKAAGNNLEMTSPVEMLLHLETLDLSNNRLVSISNLEMLHNLKILNLSGNRLLSEQFTLIQMLVQNNMGLTHLNLADIEFQHGFAWLPPKGPQGEFDLVELDISRTGSFPDFYQIPMQNYPNLKIFRASGNHIQFAGPMMFPKELKELDLSDNELQDLYSFIGLNKLQRLNLNGNVKLPSSQVRSLIQQNSELTHLSVAGIKKTHDYDDFWLPNRWENLIELDISQTGHYFDLYSLNNFSRLKVLKVSTVGLETSGSLNNLYQLEELDLSGNQLIDLGPLTYWHNLKKLNLNGNSNLPAFEVRSILQHNPNLTHLYLAGIPMGSDLSWLPQRGILGEFDLTELDISYTGVYQDLMPVNQYSNLKLLKSAGNHLQMIGPMIDTKGLEVLDLSDNQLLEVHSLHHLQQLKELNLSGNSNLSAFDVNFVIQNNINLTHLGIADIYLGNDLNGIFSGNIGSHKWQELDISRTGVSDFPSYADLYDLRVLKASDNLLMNVFLDVPKLEILDLSNNQLTGFYINTSTLRQLNLNGNSNLFGPIDSIIQNNPGLTHLKLADIHMGNDLSWLPPSNGQDLFNFIELDISRTGQMWSLEGIQPYQNLRVLRAEGLNLKQVEPINWLPDLEILDLSENDLATITPIFGLYALKQLDLRGNNNLNCFELNDLEMFFTDIEFYRPNNCLF